jgi:D-glycero-D-manno-heptose 1,7-bisphosphate phosphatase
MSGRLAAFLDRDGTIIHERHYIADPDAVELLPGAADALRRLAMAGYALIVVTNQSGIARGLYAEADFHAVQARLEGLLAAAGVALDAVFYCPHHPEYTGACECRKPDLGMYRQAQAALGLDLERSLYIGDRLRDVQPGLALRGRPFLVRSGHRREGSEDVPTGVVVADDLADVARRVAGEAVEPS